MADNNSPSQQVLAERKAKMLARLEENSKRRKEGMQRIRDALEASLDPNECVTDFWKAFNSDKKEIAAQLESSSDLTVSELDSMLNDAVESCRSLQARAAQASRFLPQYDIRLAMENVSTLLKQVNEVRQKTLPKPSFTFKSRRCTASSVFDVSQEQLLQEIEADSVAENVDAVNPDRAVMDKQGQTIVVPANVVEGGDFVLARLTNCTVHICGPSTAMRFSKLENCTVVAAPVYKGSVIMEEIVGCKLHLAAQQIRIHHCHRTDMQLCVRGGPIIEDTDTTRFGPYSARLQSTYGLMDGLDYDSDEWRQVEDFKWLKKEKSPNWDVLPEAERLSPPEIPAESANTTTIWEQ